MDSLARLESPASAGAARPTLARKLMIASLVNCIVGDLLETSQRKWAVFGCLLVVLIVVLSRVDE